MKYISTNKLLLGIVIVLAAILRFWHLGSNPPSLSTDEVSFGYNAYSILKTGRDEYGNFMPYLFKSFGEYKSPLYVYLQIPSILLFDLNEFSVRFPSAFFGTLTVLVLYFLVNKIYLNKSLALLSAFFLAISPWHLQFSRAAFEANLMVFLNLSGLLFFLLGRENKKLLILSAFSFGLAFNSYHGARLWTPLFVAMCAFFFRNEIIKLKSKLVLPTVVLFILIAPAFFHLQQLSTRASAVSIFNKPDIINAFITGYLSHFSAKFLFMSGDSIGAHSVPGMGELYLAELPFVILGLLALIKSKVKESKFFLFWLLLSPIPAAIATPVPHALRFMSSLPIWPILTASGLIQMTTHLKKNVRIIILGCFATVLAYNVMTYFHLYYKHYPLEKARDWNDGYKVMIQHVASIKDNYQSVAISDYFGYPYIYILFYSKYDPSEYLRQKDSRQQFANYEFFGASWSKTKPGKALVVTPFWQSHSGKVKKNIFSANGDLTFIISED